MPKVFTSKSQRIGELGENLACKYAIANGYTILDRNYTIQQGEIDIVASNNEYLVFFEVKSSIVSKEFIDSLIENGKSVPHETPLGNMNNEEVYNATHGIAEKGTYDQFKIKGQEISVRPEDNMHPRKLQKLYRTIEIYLSDKDVLESVKWRIDLLCVFMDIHTKRTKVIHYQNVNID